MQAPTLFARHGMPNDEVADIDHVSQLTNLRYQNGFLVQILSLPIEDIQTVEGALQTEV